MANNCYNSIEIIGTPENIKTLKEIFNAENFDLIGTGEWLFDIKTKDAYEDFGTRWFDIGYTDVSEESMIVSGDSAWSPPDAFFLKLSKKYNLEIILEYEEAGCDIGGAHRYSNGEITEQYDTTYQMYKYKEDGIYDLVNNYFDDADEYETFEEWKEQTIDKEVIELLTKEENKELEEKFNESK